MLKCMIADDEKIIRETIATFIDWEALGLRLIGVCKDGLEAFDLIMDESPDISLIDIRMPGLSGLELIERAASIDPDMNFIILSGYGEFSYAQQAMRFGVRHYLLKPCSPAQIIEAMQKTIEEHKERVRLHELENHESLRQHLFRTVHEYAVILSSHPERNTMIQEKLFSLMDLYSDLDFQQAIVIHFLTWMHHELSYSPGSPLSQQLSAIRKAATTEEIQSQVQNYLHHLPASLPTAGHLPKEFILKCIDYTKTHYDDPCLTLKWIAENHLFMNVDYVSKQFIKQTGERYSHFLNCIRIDHAKELLCRGNLTFYEIAQRVGYGNNPQYFSQVFKKITGQTPTAFVQSL